MRRFLLISLAMGMVVPLVEARRFGIPRNANAAPKTLADQQAENDAAAARRKEEAQKHNDQTHPQQPQATTEPASQLGKAQLALTQVERRLWAEFVKQDDYVKAKGALSAAQDNYDAAYKAMVTKLGDKPEYAAATQDQQAAEAALSAARKDPATSQDMIADLAVKARDARAAAHKLEGEAAEKDETLKDAKAKIAEAKSAVDALRKGFMDSLKSNPDYIAAQQAVDEAKAPKA